jgi:mRNA-degrading endonuclease toxin of MazEF toxin-antitoxin module
VPSFDPGQIVIVEWRDALPKEANKRPAVVIEDAGLLDPAYPNVILVPLTDDANLVIADLSVRIDPTPENGCAKTCFALSPLVTGTPKARIRGTASRVTIEQLASIRRRVGEAIGLGHTGD